MRIVHWAELSKMDVGTIFQEVAPNHVGDLEILGAVWSYQGKPSELVSARLLPVSLDVVALSLTADELRQHGLTERDVVVEHPSGHSREHAASPGRRWLVWEHADRERLACWLLNPVEAAGEMNAGAQVRLKVEETR